MIKVINLIKCQLMKAFLVGYGNSVMNNCLEILSWKINQGLGWHIATGIDASK